MIALGRPNTGLIRLHHPSCPGRQGRDGCICPSSTRSAADTDPERKGTPTTARALPSTRVNQAPGRCAA